MNKAKQLSFLVVAFFFCSFSAFSGEPETQAAHRVDKVLEDNGAGKEEPQETKQDKSCSCNIL